MIVSIASWYVAALIRAVDHVGTLLAMVFAAAQLVAQAVYFGLMTFFFGTGASRFLFQT